MKTRLNLKIIKEISNENIKLRKISKKDKNFLYKSLKIRDITKNISLGPLNSLKHSKSLIKKHLKNWKELKEFVYIIELLKYKSIIKIGFISIWNINWKNNRAEIGIWIIPEYWNKGFGSKALSIVKNIAFKNLNLHRLEAHIIISNKKSLSLFQKSGFQKEGILKDYLKIQKKYYNSYLLSKINKKD
jgi:RimJ/RimL family protein N-acetyltransferase